MAAWPSQRPWSSTSCRTPPESTATRLVHALEAQFPDQTFEEVRHPRVESVEDLELAVGRARGRPAVVFYTLVKPELRDAMRRACRRARVHYCDLLGQPIDACRASRACRHRVARVRGRRSTRATTPRIEAIEFAVRYDDGIGGGLDEPTRCSSASRERRRRRSRCISQPRLQDRERADRRRHRAAPGSLPDQSGQGRRTDDRRQPARRDPHGTRAPHFGGTARQYSSS